MKKFFAFAFVLSLCGVVPAYAAPGNPMVKTAQGAIEGRVNAASHVASFKGIPFAAPPVGELRWRAPEPPEAWKGVRDASEFAPSCMQRVHGDFLPWTKEFLVHGAVSEDCLYLNIWTPRARTGAELPVLVYIPGGAFAEGSGSVPIYDGTNLAATGLVVVTINYRLGVFGFLATPELAAESKHHSAGDYGLLDQMAALQWVKRNIGAFGGNPRNVTVWGQSAGAMSVGALLVSPLAKGLFERAVADSGLGAASLHFPTLGAAEQTGERFAAAHHADSLKALRGLPADELLPGPKDHFRFEPVVDGWALPGAVNAMNQTDSGSDVPVITGYQANDSLLFTPPIRSRQDYDVWANRYGAMAAEFRQLYPAGGVEQMQEAVMESNRDRDRVSMYLWAKERMAHHRSAIYTYYFDRAVPWPQHPEFGAFHSGELPYFFRNLNGMNRPWQPMDHEVARTASAYLKAFAATGNPNAPGLLHWPAVDRANPKTMELGETMGPMPLADKAHFQFWVRYFESEESRSAPIF